MKCNRLVIYGWKTARGLKANPNKPIILGSVEDINMIPPQFKHTNLFSHAEICGGEIQCTIDLEYIPYYGGSDPVIDIRFICNKCKYNHANENGLPYDADSLAKFVTNKLLDLKGE